MDTFFIFLKKGLVATMFVVFAFVATYIPQQSTQTAHAGGVTGGSTEPTQMLNNVELTGVNLSTLYTSLSAAAIEMKEFILDSAGWILAKQILRSMRIALVDWINSGFKGRPMFVEDIQGFLLEAADRVFGEYIEGLGGLASFICSPFQLDIQISLELMYQQIRLDQPAPTCTLTGIIDNIEGMMTGTQGSFEQGGWNDWFDVTSQPDVYTPMGSLLSAQRGAQAAIVNARGEERTILGFGDGMMSTKDCEDVEGPDGLTKLICSITTPGKLIHETLANSLDTDRGSLITADEIGEVLDALMGQLANQVFGQAKGLLGLNN